MIFVTVGTQLPFDRLVAAMDEWFGRNPDIACFAQIGRTSLVPKHVEWVPFLTADAMADCMQRARLVVSHAGMGTMITSLQAGRPLLMMPRLLRYGEVRNDHQLATLEAFARMPNIFVAEDETRIGRCMDELRVPPPFQGDALGPHASPQLLDAVRGFIDGRIGGRVR